jgi:L-threonylcarbamoyladenylate synthase
LPASPSCTMRISVEEAARLLCNGEVAAFPTETVYGLGANALDAKAVAKIYVLKGRPATSPLIVHAASIEMAKTLVREWPAEADALAHRYWPGPLTLVLPKAAHIPDIVTSGLDTVGIRAPRHEVALELIRQAGVPIAAPSANKFMQVSPTTAQHVEKAFGGAVPVVDGGPCEVGIESTVVRITNGKLELLRPGMISFENIQHAALEGEAHPAPGMHHRHYSPRTPLLLVNGPSEIPTGLGAYIWREKFSLLPGIHMPPEPAAYAAKLYDALHELDAEGWPWIAIELPPPTPEWSAILDRLQRAAAK